MITHPVSGDPQQGWLQTSILSFVFFVLFFRLQPDGSVYLLYELRLFGHWSSLCLKPTPRNSLRLAPSYLIDKFRFHPHNIIITLCFALHLEWQTSNSRSPPVPGVIPAFLLKRPECDNANNTISHYPRHKGISALMSFLLSPYQPHASSLPGCWRVQTSL